ncbi:MAG TPA: AAA family ATPase, partial [Thermoleophilaceae bacterium]|nr:AAA family ATPase [Thermoleophilaceae bacterium]
MDQRPGGSPIKRRDVYPNAVVDGQELQQNLPGRLRSRWQSLMVSKGERDEAEIEEQIRTVPGVTRANTVAMISPKGGVGKTTSSFVVGNLLSNTLRMRTIVVDANPDFGTLAALAPDQLRPERNLADLINDLEKVHTAAELGPYVSRLPSGLHLLGAPTDAELMAKLGPEAYGHLLAFLSIFYEVILLDLGTGITDPLARFAVERSDQLVLVTTPEFITSQSVAGALRYLAHERATLVLNQASGGHEADIKQIEAHFREQRLRRSVTIPRDERLRTMLDTGTYSLGALDRDTRRPVK